MPKRLCNNCALHINRPESTCAINSKVQNNGCHRFDEQLAADETLGDVHAAVHLSRVMLEIRRIVEFALTLADDTMFSESTMPCKKLRKNKNHEYLLD